MSPCRARCHSTGEELILRREGCDLVHDLNWPAKPQDVADINRGGGPTLKSATSQISLKRYGTIET
jgi:hypothetical protein